MLSPPTKIATTPVTLFKTRPSLRAITFTNLPGSAGIAYFSLNNKAVLSAANGTAVSPGKSVTKNLTPGTAVWNVQALAASTATVTAQTFPL